MVEISGAHSYGSNKLEHGRSKLSSDTSALQTIVVIGSDLPPIVVLGSALPSSGKISHSRTIAHELYSKSAVRLRKPIH